MQRTRHLFLIVQAAVTPTRVLPAPNRRGGGGGRRRKEEGGGERDGGGGGEREGERSEGEGRRR